MASTPDNRDLRDPEKLGKLMLSMKQNRTDAPMLRHAADMIDDLGLRVPNVDPNPVDHGHSYHMELKERAAEGDKFAIALLRGSSLAEDPTD